MAKRRRERRLRFTREGWWVTGIALGVGFAAINTGHNLLFFGWGLLLAAIVTSGVLSEATLRGLRITLGRPEEQRAGTRSPLPLVLDNPRRRMPAFALESEVVIGQGDDERAAPAAYLLRLDAGEERETFCEWTPSVRGVYEVRAARARTSYPFGFFEKTRTVRFKQPRRVLVWPARIELERAARTLLSRLGSASTNRAGMGEEFFSLRPFVVGDDPRMVHWRRSARTGEWFTKEHEARASREVVLQLALDPDAPLADVEHALACLGSLAEDLLASGCAVGVITAGIALAPASGPRQRSAILSALALVDPAAPAGALPRARSAARVGVLTAGARAPAGVDQLLELDGPARERAA